jgi:arylsulfatase A
MVWLVDWCVGQVAAKLEALDLSGNTLLIVTSDNGPLPEGTAKITNGHLSAGKLRGQKGRVWEGGHRIPFIARWPDKIPAGKVSDGLLCFTDLMATFATLVGGNIPQNTGEDGVDRLTVLLGEAGEPHPPTVHHSSTAFAMRSGKWKIVFGEGDQQVKTAPGHGYLFNLEDDPGETRDLWNKHPDLVDSLTRQFEAIAKGGQPPPPPTK